MHDNYFTHYILSYFNLNKVTTVSQIIHVLKGKRTASMFFLTEVNNWHHGFAIQKRMTREELKEIMNYLFQKQLLIKKDKGYLLSATGKETLDKYFDKHYFPKRIKSFSNLSLRSPFWDRMQLFTQVFSEHSYQNTQYVPIVKDPMHQESVRLVYQAADGNIDFFLKQWVKEQEFIFEQIDKQKADILVNFLTGYGRVGKTRGQLAKKLEMQIDEFDFYLRDLLEELIETIKENRKKLPLIYKVLEQTNEEVFLGLSQSTYQSYQLFQQGATTQQIAKRRYIKENTVKEHLLEIAFILEKFPVLHFVPAEMYEYLNEQFDSQEEYSFQQAVTANETLEFYQYRLVELERMRSNCKKQFKKF